MATRKAAAKSSGRTLGKTGAKKTAAKAPKSMPKSGKDPEGGLTAAGRAYFAKKEGSHLRPGVQGPADTPEKMVRKGSFLRRHFAHPRGPMKDETGEPTRLALSAHAWGEAVPQTAADAKKLAEEGHELLEQYHEIKDGSASGGAGTRKTAAKKKAAKGTSAKTATKSTVRKAAGNTSKAAGKKAAAKTQA